MFEVVRFQSPSAGAQELAPAANRPGLRHVAFKVDEVRGVVDRVPEAGWETVGRFSTSKNTFLLSYGLAPEPNFRVGPLYCIVTAPTRRRPWSNTAVCAQLRDTSQLRPAWVDASRRTNSRRAPAVEMAREGVPLS